ncbi:T9SS type A sorting domain-containing protein, partial [Flavobacterium johnsoniae]
STIGGNDFWVVKLKDKAKVEKVKASIEAIPNPAVTYTNVIIGYDFTEGTASVIDILGRILQQFSINSRTVPVDLSHYAEGIYIIKIKTDVKTESVKVIKTVR